MDLERYRNDPNVKHLLARLDEDDRMQVDMSVMQELENLTSYGKTKRDISAAEYKTRESLHSLAKPYEEIQHYRSRVLRIRTGYMPILRVLKRMWQVGVSALYQHDDIIKISPVSRRDAVFVAILEPLRERIDNCEMVIETANDVEKLLGNAYYTIKELRAINEAFLYEHRRERNV